MTRAAPTLSRPAALSKPAAIRRFRYALQTIALLFAATMVCVFVAILGDRFPRRFDATATREHQLAPRTLEMLGALQGDYELVVAANFSTLDQTAARRTQDVLDNLSRSSPHVRTTIIDVSSARGLGDLDALLTRLVERFKPDIESQRKGVAAALALAPPLHDALMALSEDLLAMQASVQDSEPLAPNLRQYLTQTASACRVAAEDLDKARDASRDAASRGVGRTQVPATDEAVALLRRAMTATLSQVGAMGDDLDAVARTTDEAKISPAMRERAKAPAQRVLKLRNDLGDAMAILDALPRTALPAVARVLERSSAAIVIGPPRPGAAGSGPAARPAVTSIELSSIYPARGPDGVATQQIDLRARTEELFAGAITSLARTDAPIIVFVHGFHRRMGKDMAGVTAIAEPLRLRGADFDEWAAALDAQPPLLSAIDSTGKRPVVYVILARGPGAVVGDESGPAAHYAKLVDAAKLLISQGKSVLLTELPSSMPAVGAKDMLGDAASALGVQVDSGRPLLRQASGPRGRVVTSTLALTDPGTDHPIARAIRGLALVLPWSVPVRINEGVPGVRPVVLIDNSGKTVWAESEFANFQELPPGQEELVTNPPAPDSSRDDPAGPWPVVVAVERTIASSQQRAIVVGCTKWLTREFLGATQEVESRRAPMYPGNFELLDACISWLAHQDSMITASPASRQVPLIPQLTEAQLGALRWSLIGGLPILILLIGALWRLIRG